MDWLLTRLEEEEESDIEDDPPCVDDLGYEGEVDTNNIILVSHNHMSYSDSVFGKLMTVTLLKQHRKIFVQSTYLAITLVSECLFYQIQGLWKLQYTITTS